MKRILLAHDGFGIMILVWIGAIILNFIINGCSPAGSSREKSLSRETILSDTCRPYTEGSNRLKCQEILTERERNRILADLVKAIRESKGGGQ